jgi:hypothetical protein
VKSTPRTVGEFGSSDVVTRFTGVGHSSVVVSTRSVVAPMEEYFRHHPGKSSSVLIFSSRFTLALDWSRRGFRGRAVARADKTSKETSSGPFLIDAFFVFYIPHHSALPQKSNTQPNPIRDILLRAKKEERCVKTRQRNPS